MNTTQQTNTNRVTGTKATIDQFGRISYGNYSIEHFATSGNFSIYNKFNSMFDCKDGFKSVADAIQYIDKWRA